MLTFILFTAIAQSPGGHSGSWILTKKLDKSVGYVWGYKDKQGLVHQLGMGIRPTAGEVIDYGVERRKFEAIPDGGEWFGGNVPARSMRNVGATGQPPRRVHLTVIGPKDRRDSVMADLNASPGFNELVASMGDSLAVQSYDPADPMISEIKLSDGGNPDVVIQNETGRVKFRSHDYPGSARVISEIRRADPRYDPKKDPDGSKLKIPLEDFLRNMPVIDEQTAIWIILGILAIAIILKKAG